MNFKDYIELYFEKGSSMDSVRVMVFYDGNYFKRGQLYFRYKEKLGWFSFPELHTFLEKYVAKMKRTSSDVTKVVAAHYYDGRTTTNVASAEQLEKERDFEMALMAAGIVPHYFPVTEMAKYDADTEETRYQLVQKGVDVEFAIDVLDFAHENRYDVAVLVTGDTDFVPLVRRITSLNKQTLVAYFSIDAWTDDRGYLHRPTYVSRSLEIAATWSLNFNAVVNDREWQADISSLFFKPS